MTVTELLIVLAIFGLLLVLALPGMSARGQGQARATAGLGEGRKCTLAVLASANLVTGNYRHAGGETRPGEAHACAAFMGASAEDAAALTREIDLAAPRVPQGGAVLFHHGRFTVLMQGQGELLEHDGSKLNPWKGLR